MGPILRKDLAEHTRAFLLFATLLLLLAWVLAKGAENRPGETVLSSFRVFLLLGGPLAASYLNHRLITREYAEQTQLFLESLPVARLTVLSAKALTGLTALVLLAGSAFLVTAGTGLSMDGAETLRLALVRSASFLLFLHAFFFLFSLFGRYRIPLLLLVFLLAFYVDYATELELARFGPIEVVSLTFAAETTTLPHDALAITSALTAGLYVIALAVALLGEGSVSALLAKKMSQREKIFIAVSLITALTVATIIGEPTQRERFDLKDAVAEERAGITVKVLAGGDRAQLDRFLRRLVSELQALKEWLGQARLPTLFIAVRPDMEAGHFEQGNIGKAEGLLIRMRLPDSEADTERAIAYVVGGLVAQLSDDRAFVEHRRWILDGFPLLFVRRNRTLYDSRDYLLRALYAADEPIEPQTLQRWLLIRDRHDDGIASGLAFSGLAHLLDAHGPAAVQAFIRDALLALPPKDVRLLFSEPTLDELLQRHFQTDAVSFLEAWNAMLELGRSREKAVLALLPRVDGQVDFEPLSPRTRRLTFVPRVSTEYERIEMRYRSLGPFDREVSQNDWASLSLPGGKERGQVPETWARDKRVLWSLAIWVDLLGCEVTSGWRRSTVP